MDGIGSGLCPMANFGISSAKSFGSAARDLIGLIKYCIMIA
jgi:hypothetical protein